MTIAKIISVCLLATCAFAQDAKIMILERGDTAKLKTAYQDYKKAQEAWEKVKIEVAKKYTVENGKPLEGWDKVDYSVDFRAVVPHREQYGHLITGWTGIPSSSTLATNSNGTLSYNVPYSNPSASELEVDVRKDLKTIEKQ